MHGEVRHQYHERADVVVGSETGNRSAAAGTSAGAAALYGSSSD